MLPDRTTRMSQMEARQFLAELLRRAGYDHRHLTADQWRRAAALAKAGGVDWPPPLPARGMPR